MLTNFTPEQVKTILTHCLLQAPFEQLESWLNQSPTDRFSLRLIGLSYKSRPEEIEMSILIADALPIIERVKAKEFTEVEKRGVAVQHNRLLNRLFREEPIAIFSVASSDANTAPPHSESPASNLPEQMVARYWIAVNGPSAAISPIPLHRVRVRPTPEMLIGIVDREQALDLQAFILNAPLAAVRKRLKRIEREPGVVTIRPTNPEPCTRGETIWESEQPERNEPGGPRSRN